MSRLLIIGAGQYGMVAKEIAKSMNCFEKIDFLDDHNPIAVGKTNQNAEFADRYESAIVAIGSAKLRLELTQKLRSNGFRIVSLISSYASVSSSAQIGEGCIIEAMAVVNTAVMIGECSLISAGAIVNHNSIIGNGCHLDCGSIVKARVVVDDSQIIECGQIVG